jgi:hypothetical protein
MMKWLIDAAAKAGAAPELHTAGSNRAQNFRTQRAHPSSAGLLVVSSPIALQPPKSLAQPQKPGR